MSGPAQDDVPLQENGGLLIPGLDGTNPLGFLAALGLLQVLDAALKPEALRMSWTRSGGTWVPALRTTTGTSLTEEWLLANLVERLAPSINDHPAQLLGELEAMSDSESDRRILLREIVAEADCSRMNWAAATVSDAAPAGCINQLQTARRDYFYGNLTSVICRTEPEHLRRALFRPWDYADALDNQSLHWDPSEDRRHAHQWNKPAGDPARKKSGGMLGANRLALEALAVFPSFPEASTLRTLGFTGNRSTNTRWTWPLWSTWIGLPVARSLLAIPAFQKETLDQNEAVSLKALGVVAVYRTRRILVEKTPNFTPALSII